MKAIIILLLSATVAASAAAAESPSPVRLVLQAHRFTPEKITVPAGQKVRIELVNEDGALEEFDSVDLNVERDVTPHGKVTFEIGPLKPGAYSFMGELHADTARGEVVAVASEASPPAR